MVSRSASSLANLSIKVLATLWQALFNLGNLDRQCGDFEAALASYDALLEQDPSHWRAHMNRAVALLGLSHAEEAHSSLEAALAIAGMVKRLCTLSIILA
jgi:tetratricopeptide (TPR) repeat protein